MTRMTATRAIQTQNRMVVGLNGDHHLLQAREDLLRLGQCQPQLGDIAEVTKRPDIHYVDIRGGLSIPVSTKRKTHPIHEPQGFMGRSSPAARTPEVTDHLTVVLKVTLVVFIASTLLDMGLRLDPPDAARGLRNARFVGLTLFWGFVVSPALAFAITRFLPLAPPYATGLLLMGITPCAPFLPMIVARAKGDVGYTVAFMLVTSIATIVVMPLAVPLMIEGLAVGAWTIARPLVFVALLPLATGIALRHVSTVVGMRLQPQVKWTSNLATVAVLVVCVVAFGRGLIGVAGSLAAAAQVLYFAAITALPYWIGCGLPHDQKVVPELRHGDTQYRRRPCAAALVGRG